MEGVNVGGNTGRPPPDWVGATAQTIARCWPLNTRKEIPVPDGGYGNHGGSVHNAIIGWRMKQLLYNGGERLRKIGAIDFPSVNRRQYNSAYQTVSTCKPDIQYNFATNTAHMIEEVLVSSVIYKEVAKAIIMLRADPMTAWVAIRKVGRK